MFRKILLFFSAALGLFLTSCQEDITLDIPPYENKLAVFCVLQPDSFPRLFLNRSKSFFNYADDSRELEYIDDAVVVIKDLSNGAVDTLRADSGDIAQNIYGEIRYIPRHFYIGKNKVQVGHNYTLDIWHKGKHVSSETTVPPAVTINNVSFVLDNGDEFRSPGYIFTIKYTDVAGQENAYNTAVMQYGYDFNSPEPELVEISRRDMVYNYDRGDDGREMENTYFIDQYEFMSGDSGVVHFVIDNNTTKTAEYLESVYNQQYSGVDPFTEPGIIKHNITGGLGVFGASTPSQKVRVKVY